MYKSLPLGTQKSVRINLVSFKWGSTVSTWCGNQFWTLLLLNDEVHNDLMNLFYHTVWM